MYMYIGTEKMRKFEGTPKSEEVLRKIAKIFKEISEK